MRQIVLRAPLAVGKFFDTWIQPLVEKIPANVQYDLINGEKKIRAFSTIESLTHTMTLNGKTFENVIVVQVDTKDNMWLTKYYLSQPNFTYTRKFN